MIISIKNVTPFWGLVGFENRDQFMMIFKEEQWHKIMGIRLDLSLL
jgi:hypothetical protein